MRMVITCVRRKSMMRMQHVLTGGRSGKRYRWDLGIVCWVQWTNLVWIIHAGYTIRVKSGTIWEGRTESTHADCRRITSGRRMTSKHGTLWRTRTLVLCGWLWIWHVIFWCWELIHGLVLNIWSSLIRWMYESRNHLIGRRLIVEILFSTLQSCSGLIIWFWFERSSRGRFWFVCFTNHFRVSCTWNVS